MAKPITQANGTPDKVMVVGLHHMTVNETVRGARALIKIGDEADYTIINVPERFVQPFQEVKPETVPLSNKPPIYAERPASDKSIRKTYYGDGEQPWDVMRRKGWACAFAGGNILKYLRRIKNDDDPDKARWYWVELHRLITSAASAQEKVYAQLVLTQLRQELSPAELAVLGEIEGFENLMAPRSTFIPSPEH